MYINKLNKNYPLSFYQQSIQHASVQNQPNKLEQKINVLLKQEEYQTTQNLKKIMNQIFNKVDSQKEVQIKQKLITNKLRNISKTPQIKDQQNEQKIYRKTQTGKFRSFSKQNNLHNYKNYNCFEYKSDYNDINQVKNIRIKGFNPKQQISSNLLNINKKYKLIGNPNRTSISFIKSKQYFQKLQNKNDRSQSSGQLISFKKIDKLKQQNKIKGQQKLISIDKKSKTFFNQRFQIKKTQKEFKSKLINRSDDLKKNSLTVHDDQKFLKLINQKPSILNHYLNQENYTKIQSLFINSTTNKKISFINTKAIWNKKFLKKRQKSELIQVSSSSKNSQLTQIVQHSKNKSDLQFESKFEPWKIKDSQTNQIMNEDNFIAFKKNF